MRDYVREKRTVGVGIDNLNTGCFLAKAILQSNNESCIVKEGWQEIVISFIQHVAVLEREGRVKELIDFIER